MLLVFWFLRNDPFLREEFLREFLPFLGKSLWALGSWVTLLQVLLFVDAF